VHAFASDLLAGVTIDAVRERLERLLSDRLRHGEPAAPAAGARR
jgi:hypothetical protein